MEPYGKNTKLCLIHAASCLEISVCAKEVWVKLSSEFTTYESYICVEVNGEQTCRFICPKEETLVCIAHNLNAQKENLISIIKDTQAMLDEENHCVKISSIFLDDNAKFFELKPRQKSIEFIGDSITSGEGLCGNYTEQDWITQWFCASKTYAINLCKYFDYDYSVISQCGWGVCWSWDGNFNNNMQRIYKAEKQHDYIIINLGTNDENGFNSENLCSKNKNELELKLQNSIITFLYELRKSSPNAKIVWVYGMIKLRMFPKILKKAISLYKKQTKDKKLFILKLDSMEKIEKSNLDKGSRGHPGIKTHQKATEKLVKLIKKLD